MCIFTYAHTNILTFLMAFSFLLFRYIIILGLLNHTQKQQQHTHAHIYAHTHTYKSE